MTTAKRPGAMLCPSCQALIARDARDCPYCKKALPRVFAMSGMTQLFNGELSFSRLFLGANVVVYLLLLVASIANGTLGTGGLFSFGEPGTDVLFKVGLLEPHSFRVHREWWRVFTAIFIHLSLLHILFNMSWLRFAGPLVEHLFGPARFVVVYLGSGALGFLASVILIPGAATAGASGAIFGLMGALVVYGFRRGGTLGEALRRQMITWGLFGIALGFVMPANNVAHIVGGASGALIAAVLGLREHDRAVESLFVRILATLLLLTFTVSWGFAAVQGARYDSIEDFERKHHLDQQVPAALTTSLAITRQLDHAGGTVRGGDVARYEHVGELDASAAIILAWRERVATPGLTVDRDNLADRLSSLAKSLRRRANAADVARGAAELVPQLETAISFVVAQPASLQP